MKLELRDLTQRFGNHTVLRSLDLHLPETRALVMIGPSGGGKSTLLRLLAGLDAPANGKIEINGTALRYDETSLLQHRRRVGTVFQAINLFPHLSGLENILLPLEKAQGLDRHQALARAEEYLRRFRLLDHARKKPAQLSGGQRQRIAIVRAIATQPELLLLDEPTSALDPEMTAEVLHLVQELREEGRDFVLVTHEIAFARKVADQLLFVADGVIADHGPASRFFDQPVPTVKSFLDKILL